MPDLSAVVGQLGSAVTALAPLDARTSVDLGMLGQGLDAFATALPKLNAAAVPIKPQATRALRETLKGLREQAFARGLPDMVEMVERLDGDVAETDAALAASAGTDPAAKKTADEKLKNFRRTVQRWKDEKLAAWNAEREQAEALRVAVANAAKDLKAAAESAANLPTAARNALTRAADAIAKGAELRDLNQIKLPGGKRFDAERLIGKADFGTFLTDWLADQKIDLDAKEEEKKPEDEKTDAETKEEDAGSSPADADDAAEKRRERMAWYRKARDKAREAAAAIDPNLTVRVAIADVHLDSGETLHDAPVLSFEDARRGIRWTMSIEESDAYIEGKLGDVIRQSYEKRRGEARGEAGAIRAELRAERAQALQAEAGSFLSTVATSIPVTDADIRGLAAKRDRIARRIGDLERRIGAPIPDLAAFDAQSKDAVAAAVERGASTARQDLTQKFDALARQLARKPPTTAKDLEAFTKRRDDLLTAFAEWERRTGRRMELPATAAQLDERLQETRDAITGAPVAGSRAAAKAGTSPATADAKKAPEDVQARIKRIGSQLARAKGDPKVLAEIAKDLAALRAAQPEAAPALGTPEARLDAQIRLMEVGLAQATAEATGIRAPAAAVSVPAASPAVPAPAPAVAPPPTLTAPIVAALKGAGVSETTLRRFSGVDGDLERLLAEIRIDVAAPAASIDIAALLAKLQEAVAISERQEAIAAEALRSLAAAKAAATEASVEAANALMGRFVAAAQASTLARQTAHVLQAANRLDAGTRASLAGIAVTAARATRMAEAANQAATIALRFRALPANTPAPVQAAWLRLAAGFALAPVAAQAVTMDPKARQAFELPLAQAADAIDEIPAEFRGEVAPTAAGGFLQARDGLARQSDDFIDAVAPPKASSAAAEEAAAEGKPPLAPRPVGTAATGAGSPVGRSAPAPRTAAQAPRPRPRTGTPGGSPALGPLPDLVPTRLPAATAGALPKPPLASTLGSFLSLNAAQRRARNARDLSDDALDLGDFGDGGDFEIDRNETPLGGDTELTDSSVPDASGRSPLDLDAEGPRSYTDAQRPDAGTPFPGMEEAADIFEGGGHVVGPEEEAERAREFARRQQQAQESFMPGKTEAAGGGAAPGAGPSPSASFAGSIPGRTAAPGGAAAPLSGGGEIPAARQMMQRLTQERRRATDQMRKQFRQMAEQAFRRKAVQSTRIAIEAAEAVTGPEDAGITIATLALQMNVQLLSKYVLKGLLGMPSSNPDASSDLAMLAADTFMPDQTFAEDIFTVWLDCALLTFVPLSCTCLMILFLLPFVAPALAVFSFLPLGQ